MLFWLPPFIWTIKRGHMPRQPAIPLEIRVEVQKLVDEFNRKNFKEVDPRLRMILIGNTNSGYSARFKGKFIYLDRAEYGRKPAPICRLTWNGVMDQWIFAIYKYSDEVYDPEEWFFTGAELVNGTVSGAMAAGMAAYPV
jgi:hypothetical protein